MKAEGEKLNCRAINNYEILPLCNLSSSSTAVEKHENDTNADVKTNPDANRRVRSSTVLFTTAFLNI